MKTFKQHSEREKMSRKVLYKVGQTLEWENGKKKLKGVVKGIDPDMHGHVEYQMVVKGDKLNNFIQQAQVTKVVKENFGVAHPTAPGNNTTSSPGSTADSVVVRKKYDRNNKRKDNLKVLKRFGETMAKKYKGLN
jgi:hypothetical protein